MGQKDTGDPGDWGAADTDYARLSYTHEVPASQWDQWKRKENTDGAALGVLELLNTWRISTRLNTHLTNLGHTVELTKDSLMDDPSFQQRGQTTVGGEEPDLFVSVHTNGGKDITTTAVRGTEYVPYKTHDYIAPYDDSMDEPSKVWSPSHEFDVQWFVDDEFTTPAVTVEGGDTPVFLKGTTYYGKITDNVDNPVDPYPLRYRILNDDGTELVSSTLATVGQSLPAYDVERQQRADSYTLSFTPGDTGTAELELRGPFQGDEQHRFSRAVLDELKQVVPYGLHGGKYDVKCSDANITCDLGLGNWVADVSDNHEPAFSLTEVAYHSGTYDGFSHISDAKFLISGGYDTSAEAIATAINNFDTQSQSSRYAAGKEADNPHPLRSVEIGHRGNMMNINTGGLIDGLFKIFMEYLGGSPDVSAKPKSRNSSFFLDAAYASWLVEPSSADYIDSGPGDGAGIQIRPFEPGYYDVSIEQIDTDTLSCPGDWDKFYSDRDMSAVDLTFNEYVEGEPYIHKNYKLVPQSRFDGAVYDSRTLEPLENVQVTVVGNSVKGTKTGESGRFYVCGIDATESTITMAPDSYTIYVNADGYKPEELSGLTIDSGVIQWADTVYLEPENLIRLHGQTTNVATGRGKGDFQMTFTEQSMNLTYDTTSGAYGDYSIDLPSGDYEVSITFPDTKVGSSQVDYYDTQYQITVPSAGTLGDTPEMERDFNVKPYAGVKGYVRDAWTGKLVDGAEVTLKDTAGNVIKTYPSTGESYAPDGYYILQRFAGGTYDMRAEKQNVGFDTEAGLSLSRNQITSVDFQLVAAYPHFYGTVKRARDGKKLGEVTVEATPQFSGGTTGWTGQTISSEDKIGRYKTDKLDDGQYKLTFSKTNYRDSSVTVSTLPDTGKVVDKLLKAKPVPLQVEVEDYISGSPIDSARVRWEHETLSDSGGGFTNSSGEYQQNQVPWGKYRLTVSKPGYDTVTLPLDLPVGSSKTKLVRLKELADLKVFVREYGTDTPVGAADVSIREYAHPNRSKTTNSSGRVEFTQIAPVQWKIVGNKSGFEGNAVQASVTPGDTVWDTVPLRPYGSVQGDIEDPDGNPVDNVTVKAFRNGSLKKEITSGNGHYSINKVGVGSYTLKFSKQYFESKSVANVQIKKNGNTKNVILKHLGVVKGTVTDKSNGDPIANAKVKITGTSAGTLGPVTTNSSGYYEFPGVPSGNVDVNVYHSTYGSKTKTQSVQVEQSYTVDFKMTPKNGYVDGKITSTCGGGAYQVDLEFYQSGSLVKEDPNATSSTGDYDRITLQDGSYTMKVKDNNYKNNSRSVNVVAAQTTNGDLALKPYDREIEVNVTNTETGKNAVGVTVSVSGGGISKSDETGSWGNAGTKIFRELLPGYTYTVSVNNGSSGYVTLDCNSKRETISLTYTPPDN